MIQDFLVYISLAVSLIFLIQKFLFTKKPKGCSKCPVDHLEKLPSKSNLR